MIRPAPPQYLRDRRARLVGAASAGVIVWSLASAASALPSGGVIYDPSGSGSGTTITTGSSSVTVDQAGDRVVIDWSTFNIASGESVTFNQPNANAIAFNRVDPTAFTTIDGSLAANGGVWLFSPGGLLFGANAQVNVGSFVGSTAQLQDTDIAAALSGDTVTLSPLANRNGATLTVTNGAQLTATNGFMVLQGETIVQNGSVVSNSDAVWYGVAEGAKITMDTTGAAPDLVDATVQAVAGRGRPSFTQGSTGVTTAHTWVGVSTPGGVESGWQTVINLGGATTAQGAKPGTQDGVVILTGADGVVDLTTSDVHLATAGVLNSVYGVNIDVNSATLDGDIGASGVVAVDLMATDDVVINGDIYGTLVSLTSTGGDLTIGSGSDIEAGQFSAGAVLKMYAYGDLTIASGATVTSLSDMILSVTDAGGTLTVSGSVYAFGTGSNAGNATALFSSGDLEITAGGVVDGAEGVILSSGGPTTISGTVDSTSSTTVLTGDLTVTGTGVVDSDGSTILASYAAGPATMTIDGSVHSGGDTSIRAMVNGADLTIDGTGTVLAAGSLTVSADRDITVDADVAGNVVDIYAGRDFHQTGGTIGFESGLYIAADGDIRTDAGALIEASPAADHSIVYLDAFDSMYLAGDIHGEYVVNLLAQGGNGPGVLEIDGVIYASDRIRVYQDSGEIHLGANADLYTGEPVEYGYPGIWIQGEGAITADAGASIRTPGAYTGAYVNIVANGANGGIDLAADIQSGNVTIQANFDAVDITLSGGSITATDLVAIEGKGNVNVLDGVTIGADYLNIYVNGAAGSQIIFDGDVTTTETIAIRNDDGDVTIGANANLHANSDASTDNGGPLGYQNDTIEITGQDITTVAGSQITVGDAGEPYRGTVQIHSDATNAGGPTQVSLGGAIQAETVGVQVDDGSLDISGSIHTYGDLTFDVSRYFTGDANGDLVTRGYVSISAGLGVDFDGDIHSGGDISIVASGVDADLSLGGMLETPGSIDLSAGGDLSLGAAAYLHSDTDSANANGINIYAYGVVTTAAGSTIVAGQTSDATADVVITAFGHGGGDVEPLDLGGDIYAQGLALSTPYGSIHLRDGDLHVEDSLAIYAYDHFIMDAPASIHAGGDVAITAYYGVQADGAIYAGGDVYLGVYGADADISLGTIEADGSIYISATGDIVLNSGGYLRADANYDGDTDYIYLSAYGRVVTGAGSSMMVGKAGYYTGNVYIGAGASDDPGGSAAGSAIDLSGDIHAGDLLLYADYGSIYLRDGDVVIDQGFDAVSYYDFRIGSNATVHTGGGVDVTAYGEIYAPGSIYADADVLIRGLSTDSNVTVGNIETAGRLSVVNTAAGGDVIVDGYLHSNSDGVGSGDLYLTSDGAVVVDGRLVVGQDSNSVAGAVQITAADDSVSGASAIDLTGDIYADDLYLNTTSGSIHIGPGRIEITSDFSVGAPEDFVTDAGSIIDAYDVLIEAGNNITLDGDIYSQTNIALNRTGSGAGDVTVGGLLHAADVVDIDNRGPGDVVLDGADIIANSDGDSLGGINITSHLGQVRGASGLLQSGPSSNAYAGYINITAYGPDGPTSSSIDLAMYMYADDINLSATNGSVHIGEGYVVAGDLFYVYAAGDITIDPYAMIVSGGALELHGAADITVEGDLYANSLILIDSGGDLTINDAAHADSIHLLATGDVSIGADADVIAFYDFTLTMRGAGDVDIYGLVSADYIDISNPYGDIVIGGEVSGGYDAYDPVVHISASGDLTVTDTGYVNGAGDIVLETTGANSALTVDGLISGAGIQLRGSHDIFVGGYIYGGEAITIVSDATNQNDGEIVIDGLVSSLQGISIVNRNTGGVTFDANATVYTYYYVGNCVECYGYRTGSGGTTSLGGLDGDIYIYSAGQVVTVAGSVIDATQGVGSDVGLVVIRAAGSDNATTSAIDLSGDIISYQTYLYADNGSVHQAAGTIFATDQVYIDAAGDFLQDAGASIDGNSNGNAYVDIFAGGDIDLSGDIEAAGLRLRGDGSIHLADGDIVLTDDLLIGTYLDFLMDAPATITTDGDVSVTAARSIVSLGEIDGGGDIYFHLDPNFTFDFAAGPGDLVVGGAVSADGSIDIVNEGAGDVYIDGTALLVADADSTGGPDHIAVTSDGQIISAAGSSMTVGSAGATTGDVLLTAGGADNPDYSAIDLSGDIDADTLTLDAANGSIHLADGTITVVENLEIINGFHIVMDAPATINGAADVAMDAALSLQVNGTIYSGGDIDLHLSGPTAQDLTIGGDLTADGSISAVNAGSGLLTLFASGSLDAGSFAYLQANGDVTVDGSVTAAGNVLAYSDSDIEVGGSIDAGSGVTLEAGRDIRLSGDVHTDIGAVRATAEESLYQYAGSVSGGSDIFLTASYDMVLDGDVTAGRNLFVTLYGGEGGDGDIDINGSLSADGDMAIDNRAEDVNLGADASLRADADGDGGADAQLSITAGDQIYSAAGSSIHVGDGAGRTGFVTLEAGAVDSVDGPAIELSGDIDAGSVGIYAYDGSVEIADGSVRADNDIAIYAGEFFILGEDAVVSGAESRTDGGFDKPSGVLVYAPYDVGPGVGIVASDVDIQGQVVSGDAILIAAYNVSGGEVTVGGADPANLGTGFTLSNLEFQNLSADSIIVVAGQGAGEASSGYDLHVADLDIDPANVGDVWLGTQEDLIVEGDVSPTGEGVNLHLGFAVLGESDGGLAADEFLVGFVPTNVLISGNLGTVDNPFGSVTLIAQGDILMGSDAFMNAALGDAEFSAQEQSDNYDSPGEGHIFIASDVLQMATPGRILQQNTGSNVEFGGLAIGLPQAGQELIFVPDQIDGESFGTGAPLNFASGPTRIELFGYFYGEGGEIVAGFDAAQVDNLLDPDLLIGEYFINSCQFYGECGSEDDVPVFHDPFPPVEPQLDADDTLSFFSGFPFEEPDDEDDEDQVQGEPVTGSGNEDLWTMKPTGVRP